MQLFNARCRTISGRFHLSVVLKFYCLVFTPILSLGRRSERGLRVEVGFWLDARLSRSEESLLSLSLFDNITNITEMMNSLIHGSHLSVYC